MLLTRYLLDTLHNHRIQVSDLERLHRGPEFLHDYLIGYVTITHNYLIAVIEDKNLTIIIL